MEPKYPIRVVASRTGLSTHLIRMWERRYGAVEPDRTESKRRLYSDEDVKRLTLLRRATQAGANIGQIANRSTEDLEELVRDFEQVSPEPIGRRSDGPDPSYFARLAIDAVEKLDSRAAESALLQASVALGRTVLFEEVLRPLLIRIGDEWSAGTLKVAHEHLASSVIRSFLGHMAENTPVDKTAPPIVVTTPAGQLHEFGALMAAVTAASAGWRIIYLGPNIPAEDIAAAVRQSESEALALSIVYPPDDPRLADELRSIRRLVKSGVTILIGGRSKGGYRTVLEEIDATILEDYTQLMQALDTSRSATTGSRV